MDAQMYAEILGNQLKGIMFHSDAYAVSCLHDYKKLKRSHSLQLKEETVSFMHTRCKSIECLHEIVDIPRVEQIVVPHDASAEEIITLWRDWETQAAQLYARAVADEPECRLWKELHRGAAVELRNISHMI